MYSNNPKFILICIFLINVWICTLNQIRVNNFFDSSSPVTANGSYSTLRSNEFLKKFFYKYILRYIKNLYLLK